MKAATLVTIAFVAVADSLTIGILCPEPGLAQQAEPGAEPHMAFEVASIKPSPLSDEGRKPGMWKETSSGIDYRYIWVSAIIQKAYGLKDYQVTLPRGYRQPEWDIVARASANSRVEDIPAMLRSLLADRFHLTFHRETKEMPAYELVAAKGGFRLREVDPPGGGLGGSRTSEGTLPWNGHVPLSTLARVLTDVLGMPVIDKTGLQGIYDIDFDYAPLETSAGPPIFDALEKALGLRLEPRKDPVEILAVDHLDKAATAN